MSAIVEMSEVLEWRMHRRDLFGACIAAAPWLVVSRVFGQAPAAAASTHGSVQAILDGYVASRKVAGAVVGIAATHGPLTYIKAGRVALEADAPPFDEHSVCRIYSMTKPVTGIAAMLLVDAGKLRLDQPVSEIVPELRDLQVAIDPAKGLEARAATRMMTMRHLLTHTAGFVYGTPATTSGPLANAYRERGVTPGNYGARLTRPGFGPQAVGLEDMVKRLAQLPLAAEPGTTWRYAIGLDVMGLVIERVGGQPLGAFFRERIFAPLKMASTGFQVPAGAAARLTTNYDVTPNGIVSGDARASSVWLKAPTLPAGGAGLVSTAHDYARFSRMLTGGGALDGVRVLKSETARMACSNLLPAGVPYEDGGFGAGMRMARGAGGSGELGWQGAASTFWRTQPSTGRLLLLMTQFMPPLAYPLWDEVSAAVSHGQG
jgi:CubicO group peptidase (beta-lactamase class C family)